MPEDPWSFDFFDEDEDQASADKEEQRGFGAWRGPSESLERRLPFLGGRKRVWRLAAVAAGFVVVVVLIASVVSGGGEADADRAYLTRLAQPMRDSQAVGVTFAGLLTGKLPSLAYLESKLNELLQRQQRDLSEAIAIRPPPRLRVEYQQVSDVLGLRVSGLSGLLKGFRGASSAKSKTNWPATLALEAYRLAASDVIWHELFMNPVQAQVARDGAAGAAVPPSTFLSNVALAMPAAMTTVLNKLRTPTTTRQNAQPSLLKTGDTGPRVVAWQTQLNKWLSLQPGSTTITVSGTFDQATTNATIALQNAVQITADGVVGPATRTALTKALGP